MLYRCQSHRVMKNALLGLVSLALVSACSPEESTAGPKYSLSIALENTGATTIYTQSGTEPDWITVSDASGVLSLSLGCRCSCDTPADQCAVCGEALPNAQPLAAGAERLLEWDGLIWENTQKGGRSCAQSRPAAEGDYELSFCWGTDILDLSTGESWVAGMACSSQTVTLGPETTEARQQVSETLTPADGFKIVIENQHPETHYIQSTANCGGEAAWFRILDTQDPPLPLARALDCNQCLCARGPTCTGGCPEFCFPSQTREVAPGAFIEASWSGRHSMSKELAAGWSCTDWQGFPTGTEVQVEVCFSLTRSGDGTLIENPTCKTETFALGKQDKVVLTIDPPPP